MQVLDEPWLAVCWRGGGQGCLFRYLYKPVLRIHEILVWIWILIRTRGSMSLDLDPDPAIFIIDLQDANQILFKKKFFSAYYFLKVHLHNFSKKKIKKKSQNIRKQGFSDKFCLMIE
jgi:hypothetical protein